VPLLSQPSSLKSDTICTLCGRKLMAHPVRADTDSDTICPLCGRELIDHPIRADTHVACRNYDAALARLRHGSPEFFALVVDRLGVMARMAVARKREAMMAERATAPADRKKLH
jgi:hypothetical protein